MGKFIPQRAHLYFKLHDVAQHGSEWLHKWDPQLDRLEEFASTVGVDYTQRVGSYARRLDSGLLAIAGGLAALIALAMGQ